MKRALLLTSCILAGGVAMSQESNPITVKLERTVDMVDQEIINSNRGKIKSIKNMNGATENTVLWSEDFSNGIPTGWTNAGFDEFGAQTPTNFGNSAAQTPRLTTQLVHVVLTVLLHP